MLNGSPGEWGRPKRNLRGWIRHLRAGATKPKNLVVERLTKISVIIMQSIPLGDTVNVILRYAF